MTTHEVLVAARNLIDREGLWCGGFDDGGGTSGTCTWIALREVGGFRRGRAAADALGRVNGMAPDASLSDLYDWNDSRTKEEVLAAFDRAIAATAPAPEWPEPHLIGCLSNAQLDALVR